MKRLIILTSLILSAETAKIVSPTPGSTLTVQQTFTWNTISNANAYWLDLGNMVGQGDISAGQLTGTSKTIFDIPCDGRSLFVRLWTRIGSNWQTPNDYTYKACTTLTLSELQAQIDKLNTTVIALQTQVNTLQTRVDSMPIPPQYFPIALKNQLRTRMVGFEFGNMNEIAIDGTLITVRKPIPLSSTDRCIGNDYAVNSSFFYICISPDTWRRVTLSNF